MGGYKAGASEGDKTYMRRTLLDKAKSEYSMLNLISKEIDEGFVEIRAYHIQQMVEKSLKYLLELKGIKYSNTHNIEELLEMCDSTELSSILAGSAHVLTTLGEKSLVWLIFTLKDASLKAYTEIARQVLEYVTLYERNILSENALKATTTSEFH